MPVVLERALEREANKRGLKGKHKAAYVYGTLRKTGWKPSRELIAKLDNLIQFKIFQPKKKDQPPEGDLPFREGQSVDYVEQEHHAKRAGRHTDLRIGGRRGMYSWATKKDLPEPGGKI